MSATEELRSLLDERGAEWTYADGTVSFNDGNRWFHAWAYNDNAMCVSMGYLTPEQAIAATLGSDREAELQKALNKAAGNWAKADDELRKALDFMRIWISEDAHLGESAISRELEKAEGLRNLDAIESAIATTLVGGKLTAEQVREAWCGNLKRDCLYDPPTPDWQAIADELNAALGGGECECDGTIRWEWEWADQTTYFEHELSCGHVITSMEEEPPNYCEECGAKIRKAVKR